MNKIFRKVAFYATAFLYITSCAPSAQEDGLGHHHHHHGSAESSDEIVLSPADAQRFGVYSKMVKPQEFNEVIKVSGQIVSAPSDQSVVSAPSAGIITFVKGVVPGLKVSAGYVIGTVSAKNMAGGDQNEANRIAYESAKLEYERVEPLYKEGIVSAKEYNEVKRIYEAAQAAYNGNKTGSKASAVSSGVITQLLVNNGEYVEMGQPIAVISGNETLTLRADLPEKYYNFLPTISTANFRAAYADDVISLKDLNGRKISSSSLATTVQPGYIPVYFTFNNNGSVVPGAFVEVFLIGATRPNCIVLPTEAITEQQGKYYVYVKLDDECYEKRMVKLGLSNGNEVEIVSGLTRRDEVVSRGAIIVKLAEASGAVPEGHSHNH
jgi:RND family efflux transporter MFP subunit